MGGWESREDHGPGCGFDTPSSRIMDVPCHRSWKMLGEEDLWFWLRSRRWSGCFHVNAGSNKPSIQIVGREKGGMKNIAEIMK